MVPLHLESSTQNRVVQATSMRLVSRHNFLILSLADVWVVGVVHQAFDVLIQERCGQGDVGHHIGLLLVVTVLVPLNDLR